MDQPETKTPHADRKSYSSPTIEPKGRVEDVTRWGNGWWSLLLGQQDKTWNHWATPGGGS